MKERIFSEADLPCWLSASDISAYLGLGLTSTYALLNDLRCPKIVQGRRILVNRDRFLLYLNQRIDEEQNKKEHLYGQQTQR